MKDAGEYIGIAILVMAICYGCSHCERERAELKIMEKKAQQEEPK